jgi:hypothetical protein
MSTELDVERLAAAIREAFLQGYRDGVAWDDRAAAIAAEYARLAESRPIDVFAVLHRDLERFVDDLDTEAGRHIGTPVGAKFTTFADQLRAIWRAALAKDPE